MTREDAKILRKERLEKFIEALLRDRAVFAPVRKKGSVSLERIASASDFVPEQGNTSGSPKSALFPQTEQLFTYRDEEGGIEVDATAAAGKNQALVGIHPCDARAFLVLDSVFGEGIKDPYYVGKRASTLVVSLACTEPDSACFCTSVGGGPYAPDGSDLLMIDLKDRFLVQAYSEQGRALLAEELFEDTDDDAFAEAEMIRERAESSISPVAPGRNASEKGLQQRLEELFDDPLWSDLAESCVGCAVCTYLCPTCHCFDICDQTSAGAGERIRIWDSCQFPLFTQQASGFNPRPSVKERLRQRIMHKFSYLPGKVNMTGCVGCGRCVRSCPVNLDIREVLEKVSEREA